MIWWLWKPWPHGAAVSDLPRQKSNFPQNKEVQFSVHFCSILCKKYFLICKIKRYVIMFFLYIKIDFRHGRSGRSWLSYPITWPYKKTKMAAVSWVFQSRWFSTKATRVFQRRSLLVYRQRKVKTFSSCCAHFRSVDNIFSVQIATTTVCITRKMHLYRHLSRFLGRSLDFSSVWEGSWIWACGWGNTVFFWGGGFNEFQVIIGAHRLSSCTTGSILGTQA